MRVLVLGAGVIGRTTAIRLAEAGHRIHVVADRLPPDTTSDVAAAVWFPYLAEPRERVIAWALESVPAWNELAVHRDGIREGPGSRDEPTGVSWVEVRELFREAEAMPHAEWRAEMPGFRRLGADECGGERKAGFAFRVPLVEMPVFLPWTSRRLAALGVAVEQVGTLESLEDLDRHGWTHDAVVCCAGLGSGPLAVDPDVFPVRGQVERIRMRGHRTGGGAGGAPHDAVVLDDAIPAYVIPRPGAADVVLGGTAQRGRDDLEPDPEDRATILEACGDLVPATRNAEWLESRVGLRPGRSAVRLESDVWRGRPIVWNYGHGGSGVTLAWGCAEEVVRRLGALAPTRGAGLG